MTRQPTPEPSGPPSSPGNDVEADAGTDTETVATALASRSLSPVATLLAGRNVALVTAAADGLDDRAEIVGEVTGELDGLGCSVTRVDLSAAGVGDRLAAADVVVLGPGNPYALLVAVHAAPPTAGGDALRAVLAEHSGLVVGISGGAVVLGPSLGPLVTTSPFTPPAERLSTIGRTDVVILAHEGVVDEHGDRSERNRRAIASWGSDLDLVPLRDDQAVTVDRDGTWRVVRATAPDDGAS